MKLEEDISEKYKESSECLNLRKMEENMAKQQKYITFYSVMYKLRRCRNSFVRCRRRSRMPG